MSPVAWRRAPANRDKARVFGALEGNPALAPLAGALPTVVAFVAYAETAVFNPATRTISGRPIGWDLSSYSGVSNGRRHDEPLC